MNNTLLGQLKMCESEAELRDLVYVFRCKLQQLEKDYAGWVVDTTKYEFEKSKLNQCKEYIEFLCDMWNLERMV